MGAVRLGKNHLRWCHACNLPILETDKCPKCGGLTKEVEVTPPGDLRPAFPADLDFIREKINDQYGPGVGYEVLPEGHPVILNKSPAIDRMDEIIIDGVAIASMKYDLSKGWVFINRMQSAMRITPHMTKGFVVCDDSAVPFVRESKNLLAPGIVDASPEIKDGDEVIIVTKKRETVATGVAKMSADRLINEEHGLGVKTKWYKPEEPIVSEKKVTWEETVETNREVIERRQKEAMGFVRNEIEKEKLPAIVSFSGGKDSLATLLLTIDAGFKLPVLFVNTGLEFDETVEHVHETAKEYGLELIEEKAPTDAFFGNLVYFGPPAKDYRWCCKTNKLGPTVNAINKNFPNGVLTFIGQRKYESQARHDKPRVWQNPWTPGQIGASPIQSWNAIHVWMYLFYKKAKFNVWYTRGLDRIGCFLCPASDLAEFDLVSGKSKRYKQWNDYLDEYSQKHGFPEEWKKYGLWRWKSVPQSMKDEIFRITGKDVSEFRRTNADPEKGPFSIKVQEGYSPCVVGFSIEAAVSKPINLERLSKFAHIIGRTVDMDSSKEWLTVDFITVYREGAIISKANVERDARKNIDKIFELIIRGEQCVGCGLCSARCKQKALTMKEGKVEIDETKCIRCQECFGPCPAVNFRIKEEE